MFKGNFQSQKKWSSWFQFSVLFQTAIGTQEFDGLDGLLDSGADMGTGLNGHRLNMGRFSYIFWGRCQTRPQGTPTLADGRIVQEGTHAELLHEEGVPSKTRGILENKSVAFVILIVFFCKGWVWQK